MSIDEHTHDLFDTVTKWVERHILVDTPERP